MHRDGTTTELAACLVQREAFHISFSFSTDNTIQHTLYTREATEFQIIKFNLILYSL